MQSAFSEPAENDPKCEIRIGVASWDKGKGHDKSIKYTWFNEKDGKASRGGEFPIEALPQMLAFAIRKGFIHLSSKQEKE